MRIGYGFGVFSNQNLLQQKVFTNYLTHKPLLMKKKLQKELYLLICFSALLITPTAYADNGVDDDCSTATNINPLTSFDATCCGSKTHLTHNDYCFAQTAIWEDNEQFAIEHDMIVNGEDENYLSVLRFFCKPNQTIDLTGYNALSFQTKGINDTIVIMLIKSAIQNLEQQPTATIVVDKNTQQYTVPFATLISKQYPNWQANDIAAITLTVKSKPNAVVWLSTTIDGLKFTKTTPRAVN
jgi:hypothetical protein